MRRKVGQALPKPQGFTIIEVIVVLAVAGLIFIVVFLAMPAFQRGQRDSQRKADIGRFMAQITAYQSNNATSMPTSYAAGSNFVTNYLTANQSFKDPATGSDYSITTPVASPTAALPGEGQIFVYQSATCNTANASGVDPVSPTNNRVIAAVIYLEQGGYTCRTNQ